MIILLHSVYYFQIFVILFATAGIVAAVEQTPPVKKQGPEFSLLLSGDVYVNGKEASVGTPIKVKLNGELLDSTVVKVEGQFGDSFGNKLLIDCESEAYEELVFYCCTV